MPRKTARVPKLRRHKASNRAYVELNVRYFYTGGMELARSRQALRRTYRRMDRDLARQTIAHYVRIEDVIPKCV